MTVVVLLLAAILGLTPIFNITDYCLAAAVVVITLDPVSPQLDQEMNITCRRQVMAGNSTSDYYHCRWTLNNNKIWTNNEIIDQCSVKVKRAGLKHNGEWSCQLFSDQSGTTLLAQQEASLSVHLEISVFQTLSNFFLTEYGGKPVWEIMLLSAGGFLCVLILLAIIRIVVMTSCRSSSWGMKKSIVGSASSLLRSPGVSFKEDYVVLPQSNEFQITAKTILKKVDGDDKKTNLFKV